MTFTFETKDMIEIPDKKFIDLFKSIPGAISVAESIAIYNVARLAPAGIYIELGSHKGKSGISALSRLKEGTMYMVDPIFENKELAETVKTMAVNFADHNIRIHLIADYSTNILERFSPYSYVFWDSGEHAGEVLRKERDMLEDAMVTGGIICSHDVGNQFVEQRAALDYLVATGKYEWLEIDWPPILDYVKQNNLDEGNDSWHVYPELTHSPNFVGAIRRK